MSGFLRFFCRLLFAAASLAVALPGAQARPYGCVPPTERYFHIHSAPLSGDPKKLSRVEFNGFPILPSNSVLLPKNTEVNVVVERSCLADPNRGARIFTWLQKMAAQIPLRHKGSDLLSIHWKLDRNWEFYQLQDAFEQEPCVHLVSPEGRFYLNTRFNDPLQTQQPHLDFLHHSEAMNDFMLPLLVRNPLSIAIVDTGVDFTHPDLQWNRRMNPGEVPNNNIDDDDNGYLDDVDGWNFASQSNFTGPEGDWPENKHGSHVAGLAAGRVDNEIGIIGIGGAAKIMSLNVFGKNGFSTSSILENAIRYASDQGVDIINMSLGGREYSRTMRSALDYAIARGMFIVVAAGNDAVELCDDPNSYEFISPAVYGSAIDGMLVTASVDVASDRLSLFSNYSSRLVEIAAPGAYNSEGQMLGLLSTTPKNTYGYLAGTSMSAPILSGAAALVVAWLKAYRYPISPQRIERVLKESARRQPTLTMAVQNGRTLDLRELATYMREHYPPRNFTGQ